jgi:hypothetical protein
LTDEQQAKPVWARGPLAWARAWALGQPPWAPVPAWAQGAPRGASRHWHAGQTRRLGTRRRAGPKRLRK